MNNETNGFLECLYNRALYVGVKHGITVASGTDSLEIALRALDVGPGDEVITVPFIWWISSAEVIGLVGATPVFVDIEPDSFNIAVTRIEAVITPRTKAILPVSLFGQMPDFGAINAIAARHRLPVSEGAGLALWRGFHPAVVSCALDDRARPGVLSGAGRMNSFEAVGMLR